MEKYKKLLIAIAIVTSAWLIGYITGRNYVRETTTVVQVDTVIKHDTIKVSSPVEIRYEKLTETLILPKVDTLRLRDTVYLVVNKEIKEYRDSLYYARVSGYQPSLDFIEVYPKTMVISKTETTTSKPSPWRYSLGLRLNYGTIEHSYITPAIGAELGYDRFSIGAEAGLKVGIVERVIQNPCLYWQVGVKYDLVRK